MTRLALAALLWAGLSAAAVAQQASDQPAPATPPAGDSTGATGPAEVGNGGKTVNNPDLQIASVKLENGYRASKVIGAAVYNDQNQQIGTVDDIVLNPQNTATLAVVQVGGFLGVGGKLVALPYTQLDRDGGKVKLPHADKNSLNAMPTFTYGQ